MKRWFQNSSIKKIGCILCAILVIYIGFGNQILSVQADETVDIVSEYAYVMDFYDGKVVYQKNADVKMYPASLTKIMTVLVAIDQIDNLDETIVLGPEIFAGLKEEAASVAGYHEGDEAVLRDLLYGIMLPSGADAARGIAQYVSGSERDYVSLMNEKAQQLGMLDTHFVNTSGLHDDAHYSTARDMGVLLDAALKNELFHEIFTTTTYTTKPVKSHPVGITLYATRLQYESNIMLQDGSDVTPSNFIAGSKTGFTLEAGLCLASTIEQEGLHFLMITGNAGDDVSSGQHLKDAYTLFTYLEQQYLRFPLFKAEDVIGNMPIAKGESETVEIVAKEDVYVLDVMRDQDYTLDWQEDTPSAPIKTGDTLGTITISYSNGEQIDVPVKAANDVEKNLLHNIMDGIFGVPGMLVLLLLAGASLLYRYKHNLSLKK